MVISELQTNDVGGSMIVHAFGAYFGLSLAKVMHRQSAVDHDNHAPVYHSDLFSMIGTLFLWIFWPSFNSVVAFPADAQTRAVVNTFLSLSACCLVTLLVTALTNKGKLVMEYVQNATLAGGVAIGTSANLMLSPFGALLVGSLAAVLSAFGIRFVTPFLTNQLRIHDTCGVNNLHGMPGVLAGLVGALAAWFATTDIYGDSLYDIFTAMDPSTNARSASSQALYQLIALGISLLVSVIGGIVTGFILKLPIWNQVDEEDLFQDSNYFSLPDQFDPFVGEKIIQKPMPYSTAILTHSINIPTDVK